METWKTIPGLENYSVSDLGRVRRDVTRTSGKAGTILKASVTRDGYLAHALTDGTGKARCERVHRLVVRAFVGEIPEDRVVNHKDGCKTNNSLDNLEILTNSENLLHAYRVLGRDPTGQKVSEDKVRQIRVARKLGAGIKELAEMFDITPAAISHICTGKTWKSAPGPITPSREMTSTPQEQVSRISNETVVSVVARHAAGEGTTALAREFNVSKRTILNWVQNRTRTV